MEAVTSLIRVPVIVGRGRGETGAAVLGGWPSHPHPHVAHRWRPGDRRQPVEVLPGRGVVRVAAHGDHLTVHLLHLGRDDPVVGSPLVLGQE